MYPLEKLLEVLAGLHVRVLIPSPTPICTIQGPATLLWIVPELGNRHLRPFAMVEEDRPMLVDGHRIAAKSIAKINLVPGACEGPLFNERDEARFNN
jgi:hypothetical protein